MRQIHLLSRFGNTRYTCCDLKQHTPNVSYSLKTPLSDEAYGYGAIVVCILGIILYYLKQSLPFPTMDSGLSLFHRSPGFEEFIYDNRLASTELVLDKQELLADSTSEPGQHVRPTATPGLETLTTCETNDLNNPQTNVPM